MSLCISPTCSSPQNSDNVLFCQTCGSELLLQGRYRVTRALGTGGFGKTYEVKEGSIPKVLKILMNNSPKAIELFQREAQVLSQLNHPGIPRVEDNGYFIFHARNSQEPVHCLVMEKVDGDNLLNYIRQIGRPVDNDLARQWLFELVVILQQVHDRGILHRDIKPQNVIIKPDGSLALIDFGAVRDGQGTEAATQSSGSSGTEVATHAKEGTSISSSGYTPIEQINGQAVKQSDFFALGRTFIYLLTNKELISMYIGSIDEVRWREHAPGVSKELAELIDSMQARLAKDRPANTQEILQRLTKIPTPTPPSPKPSPIPPPIPPSPPIPINYTSKKPWLMALGLGIPAVVVIAILYGLSSNRIDTSIPPNLVTSPTPQSEYPKQECGTGAGYRVFIQYTPENLSRVQNEFCQDAFRVGDSVQIASFSRLQDANEFTQFMSNSFGSAWSGN